MDVYLFVPKLNDWLLNLKEIFAGQVTVQVKVGSILALFPVWEDGDDEESDDDDKQGHSDSLLNVVFTPRRAHKSYENMTMIGEPGSARSWKIQEYNYDSDDESRGSCWCFCRPKRKKEKVIQDKASKRRLNYEVKQNPASKKAISNGENCKQYANGTSKNSHSRSVPQRELSNLRHDSKNNVMSPRSGRCDTRVLYSKGEISEAKLNSELREIYRNSLSSLNNRIGSCDSVNLKQNVQSVRNSTISLEGKENLPPDQSGKILRNSSLTKEQKLKKNHSVLRDSLKSDTKEPVEHCVMWKRRGPTFDNYAEKFYNTLDNAVNMDIIKYFEQERGSLVLSVSVEDCLVICTICMTRQQIQHVTEDIENGELLKMFESLLLSQEIKDTICVSDLKLKVVVQQEEITLAFQELS